jgi:hypothetical protein
VLSHLRRGEILPEGPPEIGSEELLESGPGQRRDVNSAVERQGAEQVFYSSFAGEKVGQLTQRLERVTAPCPQIVMQGGQPTPEHSFVLL